MMTDRIQAMLEYIRAHRHHALRRGVDYPAPEPGNHMERVTAAFRRVLEAETPVVLEGERILFWRTVRNLPDILSEDEWEVLRRDHFLHEAGRVCNISPNYEEAVATGLLAKRERAVRALEGSPGESERFYRCVISSIDGILDLTERYRQAALEAGNTEAAKTLARVPARGARTFREALQSLRILHYALWCEGEYHNTLGRFDQYMFPYLKADLESGRLTEEVAFELLEEFFLCLNRDSDLYPGIQQGDNGQSMVLGGVDRQGNPCFNRLSELCLEASRELKLIDPKINLRVDGATPLKIYEKGTLLTREGLGFPQYSNDDVVIPGLLEKGYSLEDARNYTVAACWEFIIPGVGMDIPNIAAVNFPELVNRAILEELDTADGFDQVFDRFSQLLSQRCRELADRVSGVYMLPAPYMSILMDGCLEKGRDISLGSRYNNYGFHGVGISTAVDSLAALDTLYFEERSASADEILDLMTAGEQSEELLHRLRYELPKFGDGDDGVDAIAVGLMDAFGRAVEGLANDRGGCFRAGTGSAMFYLWYAKNVDNALSGHRRGEAFSANYAPELFVRSKGPLSVIQSFTRPDLTKAINGGPLTMEFHASLFRDAYSICKVAGLVRAFVQSGGHQLQLNSVNIQTLLDAQKHPDQYSNLIVRIWGWSAYFVELDREYQDHVIARQNFTV